MHRAMQKSLGILSATAMYISVGLMAATALIGLADVVMLHVFQKPIPAANDLSAAMLPLIVVLALSHIQRGDGHIAVDLVTSILPSAMDRALRCLGYACATLVLAAISRGAWSLALDSIALNEWAISAVRFPVWPSKTIFAIGLTVATLQAAAQFVTGVSRLVRSLEGSA